MKSRANVRIAPGLLPSWRIVAVTGAVALLVSVGSYLARPSSLRIDGQRVISDVPPVTRAHEAYVPVRVIGDSLGAETNYDPKTGIIEIIHGTDTLRMRAGIRLATLDGRRIVLDHAPFTVRGRTMVSREVIASAFRSRMHYDPAHAKIDVITPDMVEAGAQHGP
ncbi:MAG: stalk domain-containing protein [Vulcanimicrobiaceae bacterium]